MTSKKSINIGIIGFGTVGTGTARILMENADVIKRRLGAPVALKKISDLDVKRDRGISLEGVQLTTAEVNSVVSAAKVQAIRELTAIGSDVAVSVDGVIVVKPTYCT